MEQQNERKGYPVVASEYKLLEEVGQGVSATVYRALCLPFNEVVAIKSLDLEKCISNLDGIRREAQMMSLISNPNVVKAHCSFVVEQTLWVVMPYMAGGSCLHIMKSAYPDGFEEPVIATVLREALKALEYLHRHGHIHRDVKAGNILVDANGAIKLGDFGVSACMFDTGDRQRSRNTFVGTPCWMAPEVMEQLHGYDFKADIWSFGITALELAHGHAPFSKYPPMKVLLMTLQNAPPGLDYERDKRFSKLFKEMIAMCLVKDPAKRPSAEKLLKHSFFKHARNYEYVARHVLDGLPSLGERVMNLKLKDAMRLAQKKMPYGEQEERSQNEYKRGVSSWNFDVEDLKAQAAVIQDDDEHAGGSEDNEAGDQKGRGQTGQLPTPVEPRRTNDLKGESDIVGRPSDLGSSNLQLSLKGPEKDLGDEMQRGSKDDRSSCRQDDQGGDDEKGHRASEEREQDHDREDVCHLLGDIVGSDAIMLRNRDEDKDREKEFQQAVRSSEDLTWTSRQLWERALSGRVTCPASNLDEKLKGGIVQRKGRFSVTSEGVDSVEAVSHSSLSTVPIAAVFSHLQSVLHHCAAQQDLVVNLLTSICPAELTAAERLSYVSSKCFLQRSTVGMNDIMMETSTDKEQELLQQISVLNSRIASLVTQLQEMKLRNVELERQLDGVHMQRVPVEDLSSNDP